MNADWVLGQTDFVMRIGKDPLKTVQTTDQAIVGVVEPEH